MAPKHRALIADPGQAVDSAALSRNGEGAALVRGLGETIAHRECCRALILQRRLVEVKGIQERSAWRSRTIPAMPLGLEDAPLDPAQAFAGRLFPLRERLAESTVEFREGRTRARPREQIDIAGSVQARHSIRSARTSLLPGGATLTRPARSAMIRGHLQRSEESLVEERPGEKGVPAREHASERGARPTAPPFPISFLLTAPPSSASSSG